MRTPLAQRRSLACILVAGLALFATTADAASVAGLQSANPPVAAPFTSFGGAVAGTTVGWSFTVGPHSLPVTSLGLYDGSGLAVGHQVGIWNGAGTLVASTTIKSGTGSPITAGFRYEAVTVTLAANQTYVIGALFPGGSTETIIYNSTQTFSPHLTYGESRRAQLVTNPTFVRPTLNAGLPQGIFGPNFRYDAYDVGGTVSGLGGSPVVLGIDGVTDVMVAANGPYKFPALPRGNSYTVTVKTQPANRTCAVANGNVNLAGSNVTNVNVSCTAPDAGVDAGSDAGDAGDDGGTDAGDAGDDGGTDAGEEAGIDVDGAVVVPSVDSGMQVTIDDDEGFGISPGIADDCGCRVVGGGGSRSMLLAVSALSAVAMAYRLRRRKKN